MKKMILAVLVIAALAASAAAMIIPANDKAQENAMAPDKSPVIDEGWNLVRVDFIHYARPDNPGKPAKPPKTDNCYKLLGVSWKTLPVDYTINPADNSGLSDAYVVSTMTTAMEAWDAATSAELLNPPSVDSTAVYGVQDFKNAIDFGPLNTGIIGVTSIWYTRRGKQIVEFDMRLSTGYQWGDGAANPALMDLQGITTHEGGHAVGMGDIYTTSCSYVTMYGYSWPGDVDKRTLEAPDITGLQSMYGI